MLSARLLAAVVGTLLLSQIAFPLSSGTPDTSSSFEFNDSSGEFTLGSAPHQVTCVGGFTAVIGVPALYFTGNHAWMFPPSSTGLATFDTPAKEIEFQVRTQNAGTSAVVTVFGTDGSVLGVFNPVNTGWTQVLIASTVPQISHFTLQHTGGTGIVAIDDFSYCANDVGESYCFGDGGDGAGCSDCPCMNNAPGGSVGGCLNSAGTSARIMATGDLSASLPPGISTDLRLTLSGAPTGAFCVMLSGSAVAPQSVANMCTGLNSGAQSLDRDGLRCAVMNLRRHGGRAADGFGSIMDSAGPSRVWGGEAQPGGGLYAQGGFVSGQTRFFQVTFRADPTTVCMRGLNTTQAVGVTFTP